MNKNIIKIFKGIILNAGFTVVNTYTYNTIDGLCLTIETLEGYSFKYYIDMDKYSIFQGWGIGTQHYTTLNTFKFYLDILANKEI